MSTTIQALTLVDRSCDVGPGDYGCFVGVRSDGQCGWYGPIATPVARYIERHLAHRLAGRTGCDHAAAFEFMRRSTTNAMADARVRSWAIGAVDCALWDLRGRLAGLPVSRLLSTSPPVSTVPAYASWLGYDLASEHAAETIAQISHGGWAFTKWSLRRVGGRSAADLARLAANAARAAGGWAAFDALGTWDVDLTLAFGDAIDGADFIWLEDPLPADQTEEYPRVAATALRLAAGEHVLVDDQPDALLRSGCLAALTIDVVGCGGLTRTLRLIEQAAQLGVPVVPHGRSLMPAVHLAAAFPATVPCVEYQVQWEPRRQALCTESRTPALGLMPVSQAPGLGITPRED